MARGGRREASQQRRGSVDGRCRTESRGWSAIDTSNAALEPVVRRTERFHARRGCELCAQTKQASKRATGEDAGGRRGTAARRARSPSASLFRPCLICLALVVECAARATGATGNSAPTRRAKQTGDETAWRRAARGTVGTRTREQLTPACGDHSHANSRGGHAGDGKREPAVNKLIAVPPPPPATAASHRWHRAPIYGRTEVGSDRLSYACSIRMRSRADGFSARRVVS